jgi:hypothetical protein
MQQDTSSFEVAHVMQYFTYAHLPEHLQAISKPFAELAQKMNTELTDNPQKVLSLTHLLISKDAAVRAFLPSNLV